MSALVASILRIASWILAGVGLGDLVEKFVAPKIPAYYGQTKIFPGFKLPGLAWFVGIFVVAFLLLKWIGRNLNVKFLKKSI